MSWETELIDLYEKNSDKIGKIEYRGKIPYVLLPPFHTTVTAQICVTIDSNGNFITANEVTQDDNLTIVPVTEKSGSRTSGKEPHPLCDNLRYLAGDYKEYYKDDGICNELYMDQLKKWAESDFSHEKVKAIYLYLKKASLIKDLVSQRIIDLDENNQIDSEKKIQKTVQTKAFVRFIVNDLDVLFSEDPEECWKDRTLQEAYIKYIRSQQKEKQLCYLSGDMEEITYLHSKKIRNEGDGSKLISSNDEQNFTYRGRFTTKEEAFAVGSETSQKIHNALKWIIRRQGTFFDELVMVTWESNQQNMPKWEKDTDAIVSEYEKEESEKDIDKDLEEDADFTKDINKVSDGNPLTAQKFSEALSGYGKKIENTSSMVLLGFDAASPGRLAMVENMYLDSSRYLENIKKWHEECAWIHSKWKDKKWISFFGMVGVKDIADLLFGVENKGSISIVDKNGKKMYAEVVKRVLPCIWNGQKIPYDYVCRAVERASSPLSYKERRNWEQILTLACSMVKKNRKDRKKENWEMALDITQKNRSYLYGRLLAVADRIEYRTYDEKDAARVTNAKRYMSIFSKRPYETWMLIEENIQPYMNKLKIQERIYYEKLLNDICELFEADSFSDNSKLEGLYLLGFHSQSYDLRKKKEDSKEEKQGE